jgi:hypothetical protein
MPGDAAMAGAPQRGPDADEGQDNPVLFDHLYWKDRGLRGPLLGLAVTIVVFGGMFAAVFYSLAHEGLPSTDETRQVATMVVGILAALGVLALWPLYGILGRITIDEDGITYRNIGKRVRIRFDEVTSSSRRWNGAIRIDSNGQRITCPGTLAFDPCEQFLAKRLEGLGHQLAMSEPWKSDPATLEALAENHEFRHPRFLVVGALAMALVFSFGAVATVYEREPLVGAAIFALMAAAGWLSWYILSVRIRLEQYGITQSRLGRQTRIEFNEIESAQPKRFFSSEEIVLRSRDRKICVGRDFAYSDSITVEYLWKTRAHDAASLTAVFRERGGHVSLMFDGAKVSFLPDIPSFLMLRILRNLYADRLQEAAEEGSP